MQAMPHLGPRPLDRRADLVAAPQGARLGLVGEQDVDPLAHERQEVVVVALDAEQVGQRQRHLAAGVVGEARTAVQ